MKNKNNYLFIFLLLILSQLIFIMPVRAALDGATVGGAVLGAVGGAVATVVGIISLLVVTVIGLGTTLLVTLLVQVSQFSNIINVPTVVQGWVIVRDISNMFFILILLIIAFATILRYEEYSAKKLLPKLLIMAVLINFSKTIFGLMIDASQVAMLTFVNAFSSGGGHFIEMFQVNKWLSLSKDGSMVDKAVDQWSTVVAIILGLFAAILTFVVVAAFLAVLVMRIIMLWIYTILSPLVFMGFAIPGIAKYTGKIWEDFTKQLVVGPVLGFFLWLALTTASSSSDLLSGQSLTSGTANSQVCVGVGSLFCAGEFQKFIIVIGLLMGGMMVAQQMGGAISKAASFGENWSKKGLKGVWGGTKLVGDWGGRKIKQGAVSEMFATQDETTGKWNGRLGTGKFGGAIAGTLEGLELRPKKILEGIKEGLKGQSMEDETTGRGASTKALKRGGAMGLIKGLGVSQDLTEALAGPGGFMMWKGFRKAGRIIKSSPEALKDLEDQIADKYENRGHTKEEVKTKENQVDQLKKEIKVAYKDGDKEAVKKLEQMLGLQRMQLETMKKNVVTKGEKQNRLKEIESLRQKKENLMPVQTFYADREREKLIREEQSKLGGIDNEEQLIDAFNNSIANDDKMAAAAIMLQAAKVGHLNEIIQSQTSNKEVYAKDDEGNDIRDQIVIKKGQKLRQGQYGFNELINQVLIGKLGMDQQQAYALQSDASSLAKTVGHFNLAESVGTKNGLFVQRKAGEQRARARGEIRKTDMESSLRQRNRLAWGDEEVDENGNRQFKLNELGLDNFLEWADGIKLEIERGRFQKNAAMNIASDAGTLRNFVQKLKAKGVTDFVRINDKGEKIKVNYEQVAEQLIQYGQNIAKVQNGGEATDAVKEIKKAVLDAQAKATK